MGPGDAREVEEVTEHEIERLVPCGVVELDRAAPPRLSDHVDRDIERSAFRDRGVDGPLHVVETARVAG